MKSNKLAKQLLNAVWEEDLQAAKTAIDQGADPNWIFNGYPLLIHAVFTANDKMVMLLVREGATQTSEALGFALEHGIGECVWPLVFMGIVPKVCPSNRLFGSIPNRYAPIDLFS